MRLFRAVPDGIEVDLTPEIRMLLGDVLPMLARVGERPNDPAADRFQVPVYLDDSESNDEWWRLMGPDLDAARKADRNIFQKTIEAEEPTTLSNEEADAFLRVLNEARLALGARLGVEVEEDYEDLPEESRAVLGYLGMILEDLTDELSTGL